MMDLHASDRTKRKRSLPTCSQRNDHRNLSQTPFSQVSLAPTLWWLQTKRQQPKKNTSITRKRATSTKRLSILHTTSHSLGTIMSSFSPKTNLGAQVFPKSTEQTVWPTPRKPYLYSSSKVQSSCSIVRRLVGLSSTIRVEVSNSSRYHNLKR